MDEPREQTSARTLKIPGPGGAREIGCVTGFLAFFVAVAIFNLVNYRMMSWFVIVLSVLWILIVAAGVLLSVWQEGRFRQALLDLLAAFSRNHFVSITDPGNGERSASFRFTLRARQFTRLQIPCDQIASIEWSAGQASAMAGRDMNDWHVFLCYFQKGAKRWTKSGFREEALYIVGPTQPKSQAAQLGHALITFLREAGVELRPTEQEDECASPRRRQKATDAGDDNDRKMDNRKI